MGAKPDMFEVGPYSYRETTIYNYKVPGSFLKDGTEFTYTKTTKYEFDPATSCQGCSENDTFIMPDILFFKLADVLLDPEAVCTLLSSIFNPDSPVQSNCLDSPVDGELETVLNIILRVLLKDSNFTIGDHPIELLCDLLSVMITADGGGPFLPIKVHEILWDGYNDPIVSRLILEIERIFESALNITLPDISTPPVAINQKVKTSLPYTMNTGTNNYLQTGAVLLYNNSKTLPDAFWNGWQCHVNDTDSCIPPQHLDIMDLSAKAFASEASTTSASNCECEVCSNETASLASKLKGTTGDFFHALVEKSDRLSVLVDDICRTMDFIYQEESKVQDIDTYRFIIDPSMFSSSNHDNCGYCRKLPRDMYGREAGSYCLPDGVLDLSGCEQLNADIIVSNPHFYGAAKEVRQMFPYLKQDANQDQTTLDIEPTTGTVLAANKRLQINYLFKNYPGPFQALTSGVYPILWLNESYMMDPHTHDQIKSEIHMKRKMISTSDSSGSQMSRDRRK
uniref:Uncharacterized protein n=1 Tax=Acrobeloides nanus TaxID=290746 RepID=A0A914E9S5_9BILA